VNLDNLANASQFNKMTYDQIPFASYMKTTRFNKRFNKVHSSATLLYSDKTLKPLFRLNVLAHRAVTHYVDDFIRDCDYEIVYTEVKKQLVLAKVDLGLIHYDLIKFI